jgi:two-component system response regulator DevR
VCQQCESLSAREREVLALLGEGRANKEIAARLGLREGRVKNLVAQVLARLGVPNRAAAAALYARGHPDDAGQGV